MLFVVHVVIVAEVLQNFLHPWPIPATLQHRQERCLQIVTL